MSASKQPPRNVVLCCDGTANQFARDHTNVVKLARAMVKDADRQIVVYHPGIGTRDPVGARTRIGGRLSQIAGLALAYDLKRDVGDAYAALMNAYRAGDALYLFGFSRGAYTARAVAAMLKLYGLVMPGNEALVPYAVDMLWAGARIADNQARRSRYFGLAQAFRETLAAMPCQPHFVGVWDTVSSVGWIGSPVALPWTRHNPDIAHFRHAIAIDERRSFFRTNRFEPTGAQDCREVWFPGVHSDVGGGYPEAESGMSKYPLEWIASEAAAAGLLVDQQRLATVLGDVPTVPPYAPRSAEAPLHNSMTPFWRIAEFVPKRRWNAQLAHGEWRANLFRQRRLPENCIVHDVAWQIAGGDYARRLPSGAFPLSRTRGM